MNIMYRISGFILLAALLIPQSSLAQFAPHSNFKSYIDVVPMTSSIPTVVEVPLPANAEIVLVHEVNTDIYLDSVIERRTITDGTAYSFAVSSSQEGISGTVSSLNDTLPQTSVDLIVTGQSLSSNTSFIVTANRLSALSQVKIDYAQNSARPLEVSLYAVTQRGEELVKRGSGSGVANLVFPERYGQEWRLDFVYDQPIRIQEIDFGPIRLSSVVDTVRFLAQPEQVYRVYLHPEGRMDGNLILRPGGNLFAVAAASPTSVGPIQVNPTFVESDTDNDGVPDLRDNCPRDYNPDQRSTRSGQKGDVCDDFDNDGWVNAVDNCVNIPNPSQRDTDGDRIGDDCDESESRLTEQYPWLPWLGMGITLLVIISLFISVARHPIPVKQEDTKSEADKLS